MKTSEETMNHEIKTKEMYILTCLALMLKNLVLNVELSTIHPLSTIFNFSELHGHIFLKELRNYKQKLFLCPPQK